MAKPPHNDLQHANNNTPASDLGPSLSRELEREVED